MNNPLIKSNPDVVKSVLASLAITDAISLNAAMPVLNEAIKQSMANPAFYGLPIEQSGGPIQMLSQLVHPFNIGMAMHIVQASAAGFGTAVPIPREAQVWLGQWDYLVDAPFVPEFLLAPPAPPAAAIPPPAPIIPPAAIPATTGTAPPPATGVTPEEALAASMRALEGTADPALPANLPTPTGLTGTATITRADAEAPAPKPFISNYVQHAHLPNVVLTAEPQGTSGRPPKSAFERVLKPRAKLAAPPSWWDDFTTYSKVLFEKSPIDIVPVDNTTAMMSFVLTLDIAKRILSSVPGSVTAAELREWLSEIDDRLTALPASGAGYGLVEHYESTK